MTVELPNRAAPLTLGEVNIDVESWRLAMFALIEHLVHHEMPVSKVRAALETIPVALQRDLGCGGRYYGKHTATGKLADELVEKIEHTVTWRRTIIKRDYSEQVKEP